MTGTSGDKKNKRSADSAFDGEEIKPVEKKVKEIRVNDYKFEAIGENLDSLEDVDVDGDTSSDSEDSLKEEFCNKESDSDPIDPSAFRPSVNLFSNPSSPINSFNIGEVDDVDALSSSSSYSSAERSLSDAISDVDNYSEDYSDSSGLLNREYVSTPTKLSSLEQDFSDTDRVVNAHYSPGSVMDVSNTPMANAHYSPVSLMDVSNTPMANAQYSPGSVMDVSNTPMTNAQYSPISAMEVSTPYSSAGNAQYSPGSTIDNSSHLSYSSSSADEDTLEDEGSSYWSPFVMGGMNDPELATPEEQNFVEEVGLGNFYVGIAILAILPFNLMSDY